MWGSHQVQVICYSESTESYVYRQTLQKKFVRGLFVVHRLMAPPPNPVVQLSHVHAKDSVKLTIF